MENTKLNNLLTWFSTRRDNRLEDALSVVSDCANKVQSVAADLAKESSPASRLSEMRFLVSVLQSEIARYDSFMAESAKYQEVAGAVKFEMNAKS